MNIRDLKELIQYAMDEGAHDDTEVRLATQPSWPFEHDITNVRLFGKNDEQMLDIEAMMQDGELNEKEKEEAQNEILRLGETNETILYLLEGRQIGYCSKSLWDEQ